MEQSEKRFDMDEMVRTVAETLEREANVRAIFGDPIQLDSRKVVPVAQVHMKVSGGAGGGRTTRAGGSEGNEQQGESMERPADEQAVGEGLGGGGNIDVNVVPLGFIYEDEGRIQFAQIDHDPDTVLGRIEHLIQSMRSGKGRAAE